MSRSSEECPSAKDESDLSSCGPPSLLADDDVKPAGPVQKQQIQGYRRLLVLFKIDMGNSN